MSMGALVHRTHSATATSTGAKSSSVRLDKYAYLRERQGASPRSGEQAAIVSIIIIIIITLSHPLYIFI